MNFQNKFTKKISFLLIVAILSLNLSFLAVPKKAEAVIPVTDWAALVWDKLSEYAMKALASATKVVAKKLITNVTQATVSWINGGMNGDPAYISDLGKFLSGPGGVGDQVMGQFFANNSDLKFLCEPFKIQVQLALQIGYGFGLRDKIGCTLSSIGRNINIAGQTSDVTLGGISVINRNGNSFTSRGGWNAWLVNTLRPQNTPAGAYIIAKDTLDASIKDAQGNKMMDLTSGQGALSFKTCIDTYKDKLGNQIGKSKEYTEGKNRPVAPSQEYSASVLANYKQQQSEVAQQMRTVGFGGSGYEALSAQYADYSSKIAAEEKLISESQVLTEQNCAMKTPGSAITGLLTQKATTDVRQTELTAALADGIDAVFGALANALIGKALNQLKKGVLDGDIKGNNDYNLALDSTLTNSINQYNSDLATLYEQQKDFSDIDFTNPDIAFPTSSIQIMPLDFGTTTWTYGVTTTSTPGTGGIIGFSELDRAKNNANILIKSLTKSELDYQNNYKIAQNLLTQARGVFATSSSCNLNYNRNDYILRSLLIRTNVISNIDGIANSDRTIASIPWNFEIIKAALANSNKNLAILTKASSGVGGASNLTAVTDAMIPINSTSFNTDPQVNMITNIKTWLRGVQNIYNSLLCPIDLTKVLQITTATSTAK